VRVDSGIAEGDVVSSYYDPLLAKIIAWGEDRNAAVQNLADALRQFQVAGLVSNASFLSRLVRHRDFVAAEIDTGFIDRHENDLFARREKPSERELLIAALAILAHRAQQRKSVEKADRLAPWSQSDGWRLNNTQETTVEFDGAGCVTLAYLPQAGSEMRFLAGGKTMAGTLSNDGLITGTLAGKPFAASCHLSGGELTLFADGDTWRLRLRDPLAEALRTPQSSGSILAPMPGRVLMVHVREHDEVEANAPLVVLEAMKMEHVIRAPLAGVVAEIRTGEGAQVNEGDPLIVLR
jgi:3-methylcrotonyl-CoA carboxylase alpha subunit